MLYGGKFGMIDIKVLRDNPEAVKDNIKKKFQDHKLVLVDEIVELDAKNRAAIQRGNEARKERNELSNQIGRLMRDGCKEEAEKIKAKVSSINQELVDIEAKEAEYETEIKLRMMKIPNFIDETVPIGKDDSENIEIQKYGEPHVPDYEIPYHTDIMEAFGGTRCRKWILLFIG
jgi:seryl-tRNA synthetase